MNVIANRITSHRNDAATNTFVSRLANFTCMK